MLILTRKSGQAFQIGDEIRVTVMETSGDKVRIGIEAPRELTVLREELSQTMRSNQQAASGVNGATLRAVAANLRGGAQKKDGEVPDKPDATAAPKEPGK